MDIVVAALLGILCTILSVHFKLSKPEFSLFLNIVCCGILLYYGISKLSVITDALAKIQSYISIKSSYINILLKVIGITYIAEFASGLCKDAGYKSIGDQIELVGKLSIIAMGMPIILALLDTINEFLRV